MASWFRWRSWRSGARCGFGVASGAGCGNAASDRRLADFRALPGHACSGAQGASTGFRALPCLSRKHCWYPFFCRAGCVRALAGSGEHPPDAPDLAKFPVESGVWRQVREDLIAGDVARELGADRTLNRTYLNTASGSTADLFVAWFQSQRGGASQPHSPKVCLRAPVGRPRARAI